MGITRVLNDNVFQPINWNCFLLQIACIHISYVLMRLTIRLNSNERTVTVRH